VDFGADANPPTSCRSLATGPKKGSLSWRRGSRFFAVTGVGSLTTLKLPVRNSIEDDEDEDEKER
jgi:hypothetical protein